MNAIHLTVDERNVTVPENTSILDAAAQVGVAIPTLCHIRGACSNGNCRVCIVELGSGKLAVACCTPVEEGMEVLTHSDRANAARKMNLQLMCENHRMDCDNCVRYSDCELHDLCSKAGINSDDYETFTIPENIDASFECIIRDSSKCVLCRRCITACEKQTLSLIAVTGRGPLTAVGSVMPLVKSGCIGCGQCIAACPTGALYTGNETDAVWCVLSDKAYPAVAVVTPEVFDQVSKIFHASHTDEDAGKLVSLLKRIGFSKVYSTEQIKRLSASYMNEEKGGNELVLDISCPAASKYVSEHLVSLNAKISQIPSAVKLISKALKKNNKAIHIVYISNCTSVKMAKSELGIDAAITIPELSEVIYRACVSRATALDVWRRIEMSKLDVVDMPSASADGSAFGKVERYSISEIDDFVKRVTEGERHGGIVRLTGCPGGCSNGGGRFREPPKG